MATGLPFNEGPAKKAHQGNISSCNSLEVLITNNYYAAAFPPPVRARTVSSLPLQSWSRRQRRPAPPLQLQRRVC